MTLNPRSLPKRSKAKRKSTSAISGGNRMTADEEKAVANAYQQVKESKFRTFKNTEYLKHIDKV